MRARNGIRYWGPEFFGGRCPLRSRHLNLGDVYRGLGDLGLASMHLELGRAALGALGDDGYADMVKGGLDRLAERLSTT